MQEDPARTSAAILWKRRVSDNNEQSLSGRRLLLSMTIEDRQCRCQAAPTITATRTRATCLRRRRTDAATGMPLTSLPAALVTINAAASIYVPLRDRERPGLGELRTAIAGKSVRFWVQGLSSSATSLAASAARPP